MAIKKYLQVIFFISTALIALIPCTLYAGNYIVDKRIICLAPNLTEICYALGLEKNIVAVTDNCKYPKQVKEKPSIGTEKNLTIEKIIQYHPNLIISSARVNDPQQIHQLIMHGFSVIITSNDTIDEIFRTIKLIGHETDAESKAQQLLDFMKNRMAQIKSISENYPKQRVLVVLNTDPVITSQRGSIIDQLIRVAGGDNIGASPDIATPFPDLAQLIAYNPEVILELSMDDSSDTSAIDSVYQRWARWKNTPAVKLGRIYVIPASPLFSGSPRLIEGLEMIAAALYPEKSKELLRSEVKQFFE
ncbi:MAG: helical backbone metal receptor [Candidatus Auribacterota bacterium]|jgi:iron complex transport system substrate-binding protein|nr:helical backbone metal receptor [Candidatus Auribacterota bacterium]